MLANLLAFESIVRPSLAIVVSLLLSGFLPLSSAFGFCAAKPCCRSHGTSAPSLTTHPACCNETSCATPARDTEATACKNTTAPQPQLVAIGTTIFVATPFISRTFEALAFESPPTSRRLATLSILLV